MKAREIKGRIPLGKVYTPKNQLVSCQKQVLLSALKSHSTGLNGRVMKFKQRAL